MYNILKEVDPGLLEIACGDGRILVSNRLQGRIFAEVDGKFVHRLVEELARFPKADEFNNLGGNSLWPAPEGGAFAWNYPNGSDWQVQPGINTVKTATVSADAGQITVSKDAVLVNRGGEEVKLNFRRTVSGLLPEELPVLDGVKVTGYRSVDTITPATTCNAGKVLLAAWSLEQLPGAEGVMTFGKCEGCAEGCINDDFYGDSAGRITFSGNTFRFELGGSSRLQIGIKTAAKPVLIGSYAPERNMLVIRRTWLKDGRYFNIADNEQKDGPWSAADLFSIFNGAEELDFHELETIAPMNVNADGSLGASELVSTTVVCYGNNKSLEEYIEKLS